MRPPSKEQWEAELVPSPKNRPRIFSNQATANEKLVTALPTAYFLSASASIAGIDWRLLLVRFVP
jgi:hypothetical protein